MNTPNSGRKGLSRRGVLHGAGGAAAVAAAAAAGWAVTETRGKSSKPGPRLAGWTGVQAGVQPRSTAGSSTPRRLDHRPFVAQPHLDEPLNDDMFDAAGVEAGAYQVGSQVFNDFPSLQVPWPRLYQQRLKVYGYRPPATEKVNLAGVEPAGPNRLSVLEEEFPNGFTYHVGNLMGSLNHIGVGGTFYNGFKGPEMTRAWGTTALGLEHVGPIVTRGFSSTSWG